MKLTAYLSRRFLSAFIKTLLILVILISTMNFIDSLRTMSGTSRPFLNAVTISLLGAPQFLAQALPLILLLASVAFALSIVRSSELVIVRASGKSALRAMLGPLACTFAIALASIFYFEPLAHRLASQIEATSAELIEDSGSEITVDSKGYWVRQVYENGSQLINAKTALRDGRVMRDLTVYDFDQAGSLKRQFTADVAFLNDTTWVFVDVTIWDAELLKTEPSNARRQVNTLRLPANITPKEISTGFALPQALNPIQLATAIKTLESSGFSNTAYRVERYSQIARPFYFASLVLIGMIFIFQSVRSHGVGRAVLLGVASGFSLYFLESFVKSLGVAGDLPGLPAAIFPAIFCCCMALALYLHYEDG